MYADAHILKRSLNPSSKLCSPYCFLLFLFAFFIALIILFMFCCIINVKEDTMTAFSDSERRLLTLFSSGSSFSFEGDQYEVRFSGKPTAPRGEPKTDIFVRCIKCGNCTPVDFKISYKQEDADFLENKITPERAANIWGRNWSNIIQ